MVIEEFVFNVDLATTFAMWGTFLGITVTAIGYSFKWLNKLAERRMEVLRKEFLGINEDGTGGWFGRLAAKIEKDNHAINDVIILKMAELCNQIESIRAKTESVQIQNQLIIKYIEKDITDIKQLIKETNKKQ